MQIGAPPATGCAQMRNAGVFGLAGRRFKNGTAGKSSDRQNGFNFCTHIGNAFGQHTVYLGQRHRAFFHAQQLQQSFGGRVGLRMDAGVVQHLLAFGNPQEARTSAIRTSQELRSLGFNLNFAPVADVGSGR